MPNCCSCHILSRHRSWQCRIPSCKCISIFGWCSWCCNWCSIILSDFINWTSTICIKWNCILINCPCGCNCCVFSWHWIWNLFIPMNCVSSLCPCWFINIWCTRIIISCIYYIAVHMFRIYKSDFITINCPISIDSHIFSWHCWWNIFIPTSKCISLSSRISWRCNVRIIILFHYNIWLSIILNERNCILIDIPLSCNCSIFSRHSWWDSLIPTRECVSSLFWISWFCHWCFKFISNWINWSSPICIKCKSIWVSSIIYLYYSTSVSIDSCLITSNTST